MPLADDSRARARRAPEQRPGAVAVTRGQTNRPYNLGCSEIDSRQE